VLTTQVVRSVAFGIMGGFRFDKNFTFASGNQHLKLSLYIGLKYAVLHDENNSRGATTEPEIFQCLKASIRNEKSTFFTPVIYLKTLSPAIEFYKKAFDAIELRRCINVADPFGHHWLIEKKLG
jgi:hypothetical protein